MVEREKESRRWFRALQQGQELGRCSPQTRVVVVTARATFSSCSSGVDARFILTAGTRIIPAAGLSSFSH